MKPKIVCGECGSPLVWGDIFCSSCGKPVEWPVTSSAPSKEPETKREVQQDAPRPQQRPSKKRAGDRQVVPSWKMLVGFIAFLGVGALALELLTAKKIENVPHVHDQDMPAANMQALQQIEEMEQRLTARPDDQVLRLQLANLLHDSRLYDKAIQRYREYLEKNPTDADAHVDLGICFYETDRTAEAKQQMLQALEFNPKHLLGHFNLGIVNLRIAQAAMTSGNTERANKAVEEANEWFRKTVALDPNGSTGQRAQRLLTEHANPQNLPLN
ncbi:MAG: tetratricopeptide repeat protein [Bacteroidota bacterium]